MRDLLRMWDNVGTTWDMVFFVDHYPHPYTRTTRRQQWVDARWRRYLESRDMLRVDLTRQMAAQNYAPYKTGQHLCVHIWVFAGALNYNNTDLDNIAKGILDAMQGVVFPNDAWIDQLCATRSASEPGQGAALIKIRTYGKQWFSLEALLHGLRLKLTDVAGLPYVQTITTALDRLRHARD